MSYRKNFYHGPKPAWSNYTDQQLLDLRFSDLNLRIQDTVFPDRMERLYRELSKRGISFRPHYWLSQEWFSPVGIPGIAIPFFIAHPRLMKLEDRQVLEVEGGTESWCMRLIRHEAGHAIDTAHRLHRRKRWRQLFGSNAKTYPDFYRAKPLSRNFVRHLDSWYAQAHPAEDFAETFAIWLQPGKRWRRHYRDWPALRKLEYVDELMKEIAGKTAPVRSRKQMSPLPGIKTTLREYYEKKRAHYMPERAGIPDPDLLRLFSRGGGRRKAATFLRRVRPTLREVVARGTGEHAYTIDQVLGDMILRCRELNLVMDRPQEQLELEAAVLLSVRTMNALHQSGRQWIPL